MRCPEAHDGPGECAEESVAMTPEETIDRLIGMGYLRYVPESEHPKLRDQLIESLKLGHLQTYWSCDGVGGTLDRRLYSADNEFLAEIGISDQIQGMEAILQAEGVRLDQVEDVDVMELNRYDVIVN